METNNNKYLWLLAASIGGALFYFGKKGKGLGDLNTARTAKKRVAQRKAVFAKMEDEGTIYKKNRKGKRSKKVKK